jgi:hypothetical protein
MAVVTGRLQGKQHRPLADTLRGCPDPREQRLEARPIVRKREGLLKTTVRMSEDSYVATLGHVDPDDQDMRLAG